MQNSAGRTGRNESVETGVERVAHRSAGLGRRFRGQNAVILGVAALTILLMGAYLAWTAMRGIENELFFFSAVELAPLFVMVVVYWVTTFLGLRKR